MDSVSPGSLLVAGGGTRTTSRAPAFLPSFLPSCAFADAKGRVLSFFAIELDAAVPPFRERVWERT